MIITGLSTENLFKYRRLELTDLPAQGIIAIEGPNESGKTSIGESICFALFGRTFSVGPDEPAKIIRWGEDQGAVRLRFTKGDGVEYEVSRTLDQAGNAGARLQVVGEGEPRVRGVEAVNEAVAELIGCTFQESLESLYLAQREIISPHSHSESLKSMAGLTVLEVAGLQCRTDLEKERTALEEAGRRADEVRHEIERLALVQGHLARLETERADTAARIAAGEGLIARLEAAVQNYAAARAEEVPAQGGGNGLLAFLFLILAGALTGAWYLLQHLPDHPLTQAIAPTLQGVQPSWLIMGAAGCGFLFLLVVLFGGGRRGENEALPGLGGALSAEIEATQAWLTAHSEPPAAAEEGGAAPASLDAAGFQLLTQRMESGAAGEEDVRAMTGALQGRVDAILQGWRKELDRRAAAVRDEQERVARGERLRTSLAESEGTRGEAERRVRLADAGAELIQGCIERQLKAFNNRLREMAARVLPRFTDQQYEHLQMQENLRVRVFSNKKRNFMDLAEISAGTQRQIMLALRLALARELVDQGHDEPQFLFLDEPFAFFDAARTAATLKALPEFSERIRQIWVVAQDFPEDAEVALNIQCVGSAEELCLAGEGGGAGGVEVPAPEAA